MGIFSKPETVILKEGSSAHEQLAALEALRGTLPPKAEKQLEQDIRNVQAGIVGEDRVLYELKNSHMDMVVLQDLFLEHDDLTAQIDFLVLTPQRYFILECKNLYGDIEVNSRGDFVRSFGGRKKEGIYSPITQNQRHLDLIHAMKHDSRGLVMNLLADSDFEDIYRNYVVLANPKTVLNDRFAKKEIKQKILRVDQLLATIKAVNNEAGPGRDKIPMSRVRKNAEWFLQQHKSNPVDYVAKYRELAEAAANSEVVPQQQGAEDKAVLCSRCGAPMVLRTTRRGAHAGEQFYGCSNYPKCRNTLSMENWEKAAR